MLSISGTGSSSAAWNSSSSGTNGRTKPSDKQSRQEAQLISQLSATDQRVHSHEEAHLVVAGPYARGGASYTYEKGPDGKEYAVGGEVSIDASPIPGDPEATARKERVVEEAATAPADPSSQDRAVAAEASSQEQEALAEISSKRQNGSGAYGAQPPDPGRLFSITA